MRRFSHHIWILLATLLGVGVGLLFSPIELRYFELLSSAYLNVLFIIATPMIVLSIINGLLTMGNTSSHGRFEKGVVGYFILMTLLASLVGAFGMSFLFKSWDGVFSITQPLVLDHILLKSHSFSDILKSVIPYNIFLTLFHNNILEILFFSTLFGLALTSLPEYTYLKLFLEAFHDGLILISDRVLLGLPVAVFFIVSVLISKYGLGVFSSLFTFVLFTLILLFGFSILVLGSVCVITRSNPVTILRGAFPVFLTASSFSHRSITLPLSMELVQSKFNVSRKLASFVLPLGATLNMNGTALYLSVAAVYVSALFGVTLNGYQVLILVLTTSISSIGGGLVPGIGLFGLMIVFSVLGLPLEGIGIVLVVDYFLGLFRSLVNSLSDICAAVLFSWVAPIK